jgi:DNA-directed RNA polymerase subunit E'/Rpb7
MSVISDQLLKTKLTVPSSEIQKDIDSVVREKLQNLVEGVCYEDGFIVKGSCKVIKRSPGKIVSHNNKAGIQYTITYRAKIISPSPGDVYQAYIDNVNKMGAIAYIRVKGGDTLDESPLIIIIPKNYFEGTRWNMEDLTKDQVITVEVVGERTRYQSNKIQVVAKPKD